MMHFCCAAIDGGKVRHLIVSAAPLCPDISFREVRAGEVERVFHGIYFSFDLDVPQMVKAYELRGMLGGGNGKSS